MDRQQPAGGVFRSPQHVTPFASRRKVIAHSFDASKAFLPTTQDRLLPSDQRLPSHKVDLRMTQRGHVENQKIDSLGWHIINAQETDFGHVRVKRNDYIPFLRKQPGQE
jgi:hypothetical protein